MPLTSYELAKTFFPGCRKASILKQVTLLQTKADEKRLKMLLAMPLGDGKQVGMPSWVGSSYDVMAREGSTLGYQKWVHDITEMTMSIFATDDAKRPTLLVVCPKLTSFTLRRGEDKDESLAEVYLQFEAYANDSVELWNWSRLNHRATSYFLFETTQKELFDKPKQDDAQMKLGADEHEAARKEATSKEHDAEFAGAGRTKGKAVTANA